MALAPDEKGRIAAQCHGIAAWAQGIGLCARGRFRRPFVVDMDARDMKFG